MPRKLTNWIESYVQYASVTEAPKRMHFWSGVSALAGVLRRQVWVDMVRFKWYPSFYVIFVAPPGVVSKTTTMEIAMSFLKRVPGIHMGPDVITWPALVQSFSNCVEMYDVDGTMYPMSAITLASGELGNLLNPHDPAMMDLYISLWEGRDTFEKRTKTSGNDSIEAPFLNLIGCTTPHWIADNMPEGAVGGGFVSRCIFVYGDHKEKYVPFVDEFVNRQKDEVLQADLLADLTYISTALQGPFTITEEARIWERDRYEHYWAKIVPTMADLMAQGYAARKQTHLIKLSMILSAAHSDSRIITLDDIKLANLMLLSIEEDMSYVFSRIGRSADSLHADILISYLKSRGKVTYEEAYRTVHSHFPDLHDFEGILSGVVRAGYATLNQLGDKLYLIYTGDKNGTGT